MVFLPNNQIFSQINCKKYAFPFDIVTVYYTAEGEMGVWKYRKYTILHLF